MWLRIARFELFYQFKQPLIYIMWLLFFLLTFGAVSSDSVQVGGAIGNVNRNAPFVIVQLMSVMSIIGIFAITAFVAGAALRDFDKKTAELYFSKPIRKLDYIFGRFIGSTFLSILAVSGSAFGIFFGSMMPWVDPERIGPFMIDPYLFSMGVMVIPNVILISAIFFVVASATRSMLFTYLGVVVFFVAYSISGQFRRNLDSEYLASLLDPFGMSAFQNATKYWTISEKITIVPPFEGALLQNRMIWVGVAALVFLLGYVTFSYTKRASKKKKILLDGSIGEAAAAAVGQAPPRAQVNFRSGTALSQYAGQAKVEIFSILKSVPFLVMLLFGIANVIGGASQTHQFFGTSLLPATYLMVQTIEGSYVFLLIIIMTFYAGELVWRERALKMDGMYDALPFPDWVPFAAKLTALFLVSICFLAIGVLTTMGYQAFRGYTQFEMMVYLKGMFMLCYPFFLACVLAIVVQVLSKNKFLGYLVMILYLISDVIFLAFHMEHNLYIFGGSPSATWSDMNGFGHFVEPKAWFFAYWTLVTVVLVTIAIVYWRRGTEEPFRKRTIEAKRRWRGLVKFATLGSIAGAAALGAFIFYNTNVLNEYMTGDEGKDRSADYEKQYRQYLGEPQPRVTAVSIDADLYPSERRLDMKARYTYVNKTDAPIARLYMNQPPRSEIRSMDIGGHSVHMADSTLGFYVLDLDRPMAPGEERPFVFEVAVTNDGFRNGATDYALVGNGSFWNSRHYLPVFGYDPAHELLDRNDRRKRELPPPHRMNKIDDEAARMDNYISIDGDWIEFEATVSTDPDQIAIAPGYLQREWEADGRRYFHYEMDAPILNFYAFLSGRYEVYRDKWQDVDIEIYHHPAHDSNIPRMADAMKKSLDYFTANFSPYQHRQARIIEFPRYDIFAQSFPNTIPFSEGFGFIMNHEKEEDIDFVFYVTAHEIAHQWWAHQVMGGNMQGSTMLVETMAQYSALMVMEKEFGKENMRKFLKYELDRYLSARGGELIEEMPLLLVENQQYIHYRKGSVVMYALQDYIGEENLNAAIADYIAEVGFQEPPYTTSLEFYEHVKAATPDSLQSVLVDLFETITLFENRVTDVAAEEDGNGGYTVHLSIAAAKYRSDGQGVETEIPIADWVDIGVFGEDDAVLYLAKHKIDAGEMTIDIAVEAEPVEAGVDPFHKLIDRNSSDNRKKIQL